MTFATKLDYDMRKKNASGYEYVVGRKEHVWTLTMFKVFLLIINLCTIMRDSKHCAITQTIHTNLISWVCSVSQAKLPDSMFPLLH